MERNNGVGVAGVAWNTRLMALKAFDASGGADLFNLIDAVHYAVDNRASVINASWGGVVTKPLNLRGTPSSMPLCMMFYSLRQPATTPLIPIRRRLIHLGSVSTTSSPSLPPTTRISSLTSPIMVPPA